MTLREQVKRRNRTYRQNRKPCSACKFYAIDTGRSICRLARCVNERLGIDECGTCAEWEERER